MWSELLGQVSDSVPEFNTFLLDEFREEGIDRIPEYLFQLMQQSMRVIGESRPDDTHRLKCVRYKRLTPSERIEYLQSQRDFRRQYNVQPSTLDVVRYDFEYMGEIYYMYNSVPYLVDHTMRISGVEYYPTILIVERGGMVRHRDEYVQQIELAVQRGTLKFTRSNSVNFKTTAGVVYQGDNITAKIHLANAKRKFPPLILYNLCNYTFTEVMEFYGMHETITLVEAPLNDDAEYVQIKDSCFARIEQGGLSDIICRRIVVSMITIFKRATAFTVADAKSCYVYRVILGSIIYPTLKKPLLQYENAMKTLRMNNTLLDESAKRQHRSIGIHADTIDELLVTMFLNIDTWLSSSNYRANDLYQKKIGSTDRMMTEKARIFYQNLFYHIVENKQGITPKSIGQLLRRNNTTRWITESPLLTAAPTIINDNRLLAIAGKRSMSIGNAEAGSNYSGGISIQQKIADPSFAVVCSTVTYPSSNPIVSGTINPYAEIDNDGNFIRPEWADEIEDMFKRC